MFSGFWAATFSRAKHRKNRWLMGLSSITLILILLIPSFSGAMPSRTANRSEIRGVWITNIDSDVLFDRTRLSNSISQLQKLNFNTLYPVVWNWGYSLYPSKIAAQEVWQAVLPNK